MIKKSLVILFLLVFISFAFFSRFFSIGNINPNLPLVFFLFYFNLPLPNKPKTKEVIFFLLFFLCLSFILSSFYFNKEIIIEIVLIFLLYFLARFFVFGWFLNGLVLLLIFEILFGLLVFVFSSNFPTTVIFKELIYNYLLFLICGLILNKKFKNL